MFLSEANSLKPIVVFNATARASPHLIEQTGGDADRQQPAFKNVPEHSIILVVEPPKAKAKVDYLNRSFMLLAADFRSQAICQQETLNSFETESHLQLCIQVFKVCFAGGPLSIENIGHPQFALGIRDQRVPAGFIRFRKNR